MGKFLAKGIEVSVFKHVSHGKSQRTIKQNFISGFYHYNDQNTLIEQSSLIKYSKIAVTHVCEIGIMQIKLGKLK